MSEQPQKIKQLDKEMIRDIIYQFLETINISFTKRDDSDKRIIYLYFDNTKDAKQFENKFNSEIFENINQYLEKNGYNPKQFKRNICVLTEGETIKTVAY